MRRKAVLTPELLPLVIGQFISSWGEWIFDFFILIYIYDKTTSPIMIALLTIVQVAPNVALSPAAGIYVDRHERTRILFLTDLIRGAAILYSGQNKYSIRVANNSFLPNRIRSRLEDLRAEMTEYWIRAENIRGDDLVDLLTNCSLDLTVWRKRNAPIREKEVL